MQGSFVRKMGSVAEVINNHHNNQTGGGEFADRSRGM